MSEKKELFERYKYPDPLFPFQKYRTNKREIIPSGRGFRDFHWHQELQFTFATKGTVMMQVNGELYLLNEGEAIFINAGVMHQTTEMSDDGEYESISFSSRFLSIFPGSRMEKESVLPVITNYSMPVLVFRHGSAWQEEILAILKEILDKMDEENLVAKEYYISLKTIQMWYVMISNMSMKEKKISDKAIQKQHRMQEMLTYVHEHYTENIAIGDIANSVHISVGECCRCFKSMIHISPYEYLCTYRINQSISLLNETKYSITEIAGMVGFNYTSQYIGQFKKRMGITPAKYRSIE